MSFTIHFQNQSYSLPAFISVRTDLEWVKAIQKFCHAWVNDLPFVFNSSGSTGIPKAITFSKSQIIASAQNTIDALKLIPEKEHFLMCLHANFVGGSMVLARALVLNCEISVFEPSMHIFELLTEEHPYTVASFVPLHFQQNSFSAEKYERINKVLIGGASLSEEQVNLIKSFKNNTFHTYGMTETLSNVALRNIAFDNGFRPIFPNQIRINEDQCICVRTNFLSEEINTNDLAEWVDENCFKVIGRSDFTINTGGIKINPELLEAKICASDLTWKAETFFIGKAKNNFWGEEIVLVSNVLLPLEKIEKLRKDFISMNCKRELPKRFLQILAFPISANGKIARQKLNEWIDNQLVSFITER